MKYMTDANVTGLAEELRDNDIDCETVHKLMLGNERSQIRIEDPDIVEFLRKQNKSITLITADSELAKYCRKDGIPCIRVQDLVVDHIKKTNQGRPK